MLSYFSSRPTYLQCAFSTIKQCKNSANACQKALWIYISPSQNQSQLTEWVWKMCVFVCSCRVFFIMQLLLCMWYSLKKFSIISNSRFSCKVLDENQWKIVDSVPNCTSVNYSTNGRKFKRLSCSVSFRGDWAPVMEWRQGGFHGSIVTTGVQSHTLANFVSQNISIPVDVDGENAISYTCIIFFMGNFSASATNIPNFTFIWPGKYYYS